MAGPTNQGVQAKPPAEQAGGANSAKERKPAIVHTPAHHDDATEAPASLGRKLLIWGLPAFALLIGGAVYWFFFWPAAPERLGPVAKGLPPSANEKKTAADPASPTRAPEETPPVEADDSRKNDPRPDVKFEFPTKKPGPPEIKASETKLEKKPIVATNAEPIPVSVARLHQLRTADAAGALLAYDRKLVDIRGNYWRSKANIDLKSGSPATNLTDDAGGLRV